MLTFLGHAGWLIEHHSFNLLIDPWLGGNGAFLGSWFPYPYNDFLNEGVLKKVNKKPLYVYLSHEHEDHLDISFQNSLKIFNPTYVIPYFKSNGLREALHQIGDVNIVEIHDSEEYKFKNSGARITLYVDESGINHDSAIFYEDERFNFLDQNDCKIYDRINDIFLNKNINIYTTQFSGATWHPTCYQYENEVKEQIAHQKKMGKFQQVYKTINHLKPNVFIPSAGPAIFLHPMLFEQNYRTDTIFPKIEEFTSFLATKKKRGALENTNTMALSPGDSITKDLKLFNGNFLTNNISDIDYQKRKRSCFLKAKNDKKTLLNQLSKRIESKLTHWNTSLETPFTIYFSILGSSQFLKINLNTKSINFVEKTAIDDTYKYVIESADFAIEALLENKIVWENFCLTFFHHIQRIPDTYDTLVNLFLFSSEDSLAEDLKSFEEIKCNKEKIIVEHAGKKYECNRYCSHQGADLKGASIENGHLVCPRHRWRFNLNNGGEADNGGGTIEAIVLPN